LEKDVDTLKIKVTNLESSKTFEKEVNDAVGKIKKETDDQIQRIVNTQPPIIPSVLVLEPTWCKQGQILSVISNQVQIIISDISVNSINLKIDIPGEATQDRKFVEIGKREEFKYKGDLFYINILAVKSFQEVQISIIKIL